jgi:hypothetical protein
MGEAGPAFAGPDGALTRCSTEPPAGRVSLTWNAPVAMGGLQSPYAPTVTFNWRYQQFVAAFTGLNDGRVYLTRQDLGSPNWSNALRRHPDRSVSRASSPY